jgi:hypothetical protein
MSWGARRAVRRVQKALEAALAEAGAVAVPRVATRAVCASWLSLREAVISLVELRRQVQSRQDGANKRADKRRR